MFLGKIMSLKIVRLLPLFFVMLVFFGCSGGKSIVRNDRDNNTRYETSHYSVKLKKYEKKIINEAESWLGTPYKYAHAEKGSGADCSGMVMRVFLDAMNMKIPRNSAKQAEFCVRLKSKDVRPGDLVFFATGKDPAKVSHVGIMLDGVRFIHSSTSKGVVISHVNTPYYTRTFMMYGRLPQMMSLVSQD